MPRIAPDELGRLYREHARALCLYARQWPDGDEDLVQDAFVKLAQQAHAPAMAHGRAEDPLAAATRDGEATRTALVDVRHARQTVTPRAGPQ